jgi:hypothetical protein
MLYPNLPKSYGLNNLIGIVMAMCIMSGAFGSMSMFEEKFENVNAPSANQNLSAIGWRGYGGAGAVDISSVVGSGMQSLLVSAGPGNPVDGSEYMGVIMGAQLPSYTSYAAVKTGLSLASPAVFEWRMSKSVGATFRVRVLVQIDGNWYASNLCDSATEYFESSFVGNSGEFSAASEQEVIKFFAFNRIAEHWREFTLISGSQMSLGNVRTEDLPLGPVTGVGFYVVGGGTGRIDTFRLYAESGMSDFFPAPDEPSLVYLATEGFDEGEAIAYRVCDYMGAPILSGEATVANQSIFIPLTLPRGYYEIQFTACEVAYGLVVLPDCLNDADGYWNIDAGLTWGKWTDYDKKEMVQLLVRKGISGFRERLSWPAVDNQLEEETAAWVRDSVYRENIGEHRVLDLFQDSPFYFRRDQDNPFSVDIGRSFGSWQNISSRYGSVWSALELWNEPFYTKGLPADQYVPVAKMAAMAVSPSNVAAGCFSPSIAADYLEDCAASGLLDAIDVMTLHLYGTPETMPELMEYYYDYLERNGHQGKTLWVSESGDPGIIGEYGRTSLEEDMQSSMRTVMRAIECKAYGVERFYAFYLQEHIEGVIAWGMTDAQGSPQRRLAAILNAAELINGLPLLGDLNPMPSGVVFGPVFGDENNAVVVLYAPGLESVAVPFVPDRILGVDGRVLPLQSNNIVPLTDGMVYLEVSRAAIDIYIDAQCSAKLASASQDVVPPAKKAFPLILQPEYSSALTTQVSNLGYFLGTDAAQDYVAATYVTNLSESTESVRVTLGVPGIVTEPQDVVLESMATARVEWHLDLRSVLLNSPRTRLLFEAESALARDSVSVYVLPQPATRIYQVQRCDAVPQIDGLSDDSSWALAERTGTLTCLNEEGETDSDGIGGVARFLWDDSGLYYLFVVDDDVHEAPPGALSILDGDSLRIAYYQENSLQDVNDFEWGFYRDQSGVAQRILYVSSDQETLSEGTRVSISRDDSSRRTTYEGLISWLDMGSMKAINDREALRFRLSFVIYDANGGEHRWFEWSPGIAQDKNPDEYPELILVNDDGGENLLFSNAWEILEDEYVTVTDDGGMPAFLIVDHKGAGVTQAVESLETDRSMSLSFWLGVEDYWANNGVSFNFRAVLWNEETNEGVECWISPDGVLFAGTSGFVLADHDGTLIDIGDEGARLPPDGSLHKITLFLDPPTRHLKLYIEKDGEKVLVAEGTSKRSLQGINRLKLITSGWGSGDLFLADVRLTQ